MVNDKQPIEVSIEARNQNALELKVPPVVLGVLAAVLMWAVSSAVPGFKFASPVTFAGAGSLALLGAVICLAGVISFRRAKTTVNPLKPQAASALVVSGIYGFSRNPMYLGFLIALLGWAVFLSNVMAPMVLPAFVLYMNRFQIRPEERVLAARFPDEYADYSARVRRWL